MISFIQNRTAHSSHNIAQDAEIRVCADVQSIASHMIGNVSTMPDLIIYCPRHCRHCRIPAAAVASIRRQNLIHRCFVCIKVMNVGCSVLLNQIIHR